MGFPVGHKSSCAITVPPGLGPSDNFLLFGMGVPCFLEGDMGGARISWLGPRQPCRGCNLGNEDGLMRMPLDTWIPGCQAAVEIAAHVHERQEIVQMAMEELRSSSSIIAIDVEKVKH